MENTENQIKNPETTQSESKKQWTSPSLTIMKADDLIKGTGLSGGDTGSTLPS